MAIWKPGSGGPRLLLHRVGEGAQHCTALSHHKLHSDVAGPTMPYAVRGERAPGGGRQRPRRTGMVPLRTALNSLDKLKRDSD